MLRARSTANLINICKMRKVRIYYSKNIGAERPTFFYKGEVCDFCWVSGTLASLTTVVSYIYVIIDKNAGEISCL